MVRNWCYSYLTSPLTTLETSPCIFPIAGAGHGWVVAHPAWCHIQCPGGTWSCAPSAPAKASWVLQARCIRAWSWRHWECECLAQFPVKKQSFSTVHLSMLPRAPGGGRPQYASVIVKAHNEILTFVSWSAFISVVHFNLGKTGKKNLNLFYFSRGLLITREQATFSMESCYYCFVLAYDIIFFCEIYWSSEYVCTKSVVLFCLLRPNSSLLSIVVELITSLYWNPSFLNKEALYQQTLRIPEPEWFSQSSERPRISCSVMHVDFCIKALEKPPYIYIQ